MVHTDVITTNHEHPVLLHVTECAIGGVSRAIELAVRAAPEITHVVIGPPGAIRTDVIDAELIPLPKGAVDRLRTVERVTNERCVAAIHAHSSWAGVYARVAKPTVPVLYQPHCFAFSDVTTPRVKRALYWLAERMMVRRTSAIVALTPHEERQSRRLGAKKVYRVQNAATVEPMEREPRHRVPLASSVKTVAMVGRIAPQKDPLFFSRIARAFRHDPSVEFVWLGDEGTPGDYLRGRKALEQEGVRITGWLDDTQLKAHFAETDIYLHSAAYEGFPLSLLDACTLGVPSLVRDIPALDGSGLPKFSTPEQAARLIRKILTCPRSYAAVVSSVAGVANTMTLESHFQNVREVYTSIGMLSRESKSV